MHSATLPRTPKAVCRTLSCRTAGRILRRLAVVARRCEGVGLRRFDSLDRKRLRRVEFGTIVGGPQRQRLTRQTSPLRQRLFQLVERTRRPAWPGRRLATSGNAAGVSQTSCQNCRPACSPSTTRNVSLLPAVPFAFDVNTSPATIRARYSPGGSGLNSSAASVEFQASCSCCCEPCGDRNVRQ